MKQILLFISIGLLLVSCSSKSEEGRESFDFGTKKFDEPFYYLPSKPSFLVKSLDYTPRWFLTDTVYLTKTIEIEFNEESIRSHSKAILQVGDTLGNAIPGIKVYFDDIYAKENQVEISSLKGDKQEVVIGLKLSPELGKQTFTGGVFFVSDDIDEYNGLSTNTSLNRFADWKATQKIGGTWLLWLVWLLIVFVLGFLLYKIIRQPNKGRI